MAVADSPIPVFIPKLEVLFQDYNLTMGKIITAVESTSRFPCNCGHKQGCPQAEREDVATEFVRGGEYVATEFVRGGVVQAWVIWEAYLGDIVHGVFEAVIESATSDVAKCNNVAKLKALTTKWPKIRTMIQREFEVRQKKKNGAAVFDVLTEEVTWRVLLDDHVDEAVDSMSPIFVGEDENRDGIDKKFQYLFFGSNHKNSQLSISVSKEIIKKKSATQDEVFYFEYLYRNKESVNAEITCETTLRNILRLYYGLRCAFAHGSVERTVKKGVLKYFPDSSDKLIIVSQKSEECESVVIQDSLFKLYEEIKSHKKEAHVTLNDLKNMISFLKQCARHLTVIMNNWYKEWESHTNCNQ